MLSADEVIGVSSKVRNMTCARDDDNFRDNTHRTLQLEPRARKIGACDACEVPCTVYTPRRFQGNVPFPKSKPFIKKIIGGPPTLKRSTMISILAMPMKRRMKQTTCATSTVVLDDILGMPSVEFGSSAGSEDCLVVHLDVASS